MLCPLVSQEMTAQRSIVNIWNNDIQPILDEFFDYMTTFIQNSSSSYPKSLSQCIDIYTLIFNITVERRSCPDDLDFLFQMEIDAFRTFIKHYFKVSCIDDIRIHHQALIRLKKWFSCFFHHLHRYHRQVTKTPHSVDTIFTNIFIKEYIERHHDTLYILIRDSLSDNDTRKTSLTQDVIAHMKTTHTHWVKIGFLDSLCIESSLLLYRQKLYSPLLYSSKEDYIIRVLDFLNEEEEFTRRVFSENLWKKLREILVREMIVPVYLDFIDDPHVGWGHQCDCKLLFSFYTLCNHDIFLHRYQKDLDERIQKIKITTNNGDQIDKMVAFYHEQRVLLDTLRSSDIIVNMRFILNDFMKKYLGSSHAVITQFVQRIDQIMRQKHSVLSSYISLFEFVSLRDELLTTYKMYLSRRLCDICTSLDKEYTVLSMIRMTLGTSSVFSMINMIDDVKNNTLTMKNVALTIVSKIGWGIDTNYRLLLPEHIQRSVACLQDMYIGNRTHETHLNLETSSVYGTVILRAVHHPCELMMNPAQAIVLLALQDHPFGLTTAELVDMICASPSAHNVECFVQTVLSSLAHKNVGLVEKHESVWRLSSSLLFSKPKIRLPPVYTTQPSSLQQQPSSDKRSELEDIHHIDAAIVRHMKKVSTSTHKELLLFIGTLLRTTNVRTLKERIEALIDKDYLSRDHSDPAIIRYVP